MVLCRQLPSAHTPASLAAALAGSTGLVLLESQRSDLPGSRFSFLATEPFLRFRATGDRCEVRSAGASELMTGDPWQVLDSLLRPFEEDDDLPFPAGGCFGFWGYDLRFILEPKLARRWSPGKLPDAQLGFYSSLVVFDQADFSWRVVSTGLGVDGRRDAGRAEAEFDRWRQRLASIPAAAVAPPRLGGPAVTSNFSRSSYIRAVNRAREYIHAGDIYQVNLSQVLSAPWDGTGWDFYLRLREASPAPYAAYLDGGDFHLASSSPELFLQLDGSRIRTRPIKGTRPRGLDPERDARLAQELVASGKEQAELLMITDLLRNDLGKVCEFGSVRVPELARLERFAQVQHLVASVEGRLREGFSHLQALAACFPGGSITGAPKFRAMQIIEELEAGPRGPYTGVLGYLGFNRRSQLSILIRTAVCAAGSVRFDVGAGIVADSDPVAEYEETLAKAQGFLRALNAKFTTHNS